MIIKRYVTKAGEERIYTYPNYYHKKYPNGKDGLSPYSNLNKKRCLERDNHTCQICGAMDNLDTHHKDNGGPHIKGKETANKLSNLITLCHRCHLKLHYGVIGRTENIMALRKKGKTLQEIADHYGVSRQRIHQILLKYIF